MAISEEEDEPEREAAQVNHTEQVENKISKRDNERLLLEQFVANLEANQEGDPKYAVVDCLNRKNGSN